MCSCSKEKALSREKDIKDSSGQKTVNFSVSRSTNTTNVRLHVFPPVISSNFEEEKEIYAMFDSGSESTLISKEASDFLGLTGVSVYIKMLTADGRSTNLWTKLVDFKVSPLSREATFVISDVLVMDELPSIGPNCPCFSNLKSHDHLKDLIPHFPLLSDQRLRLIIGARENFFSHRSRVRQAPPGIPWAAKTKLGWIVYGESFKPNSAKNFNFVRVSNENLDAKLDLWLETNFDESRHDESKALSRDDAKVISIYQNSVKRVGNNYSISLPFKCDNVIMPNNFNAAKREILNLSQSLVKSPKKLNAYVKFMQQLFKEKHAVILTDEEVIGKVGKFWYLNYHLVHSSGKDSVVFNCSGEFQNISLDSMLFKGPTLENTLLGVLLRFRIFKNALVRDIKKMYYQCFVNEPFQNFMRILWFLDDSSTSKIIHCKMTRLAYGLICSQSGAQFCLRQTVANTEVEISKFTRNLASSSFYVDDFLTSVSSTHELFTVCDEIWKLMHSGGFHLTKFFYQFSRASCKVFAGRLCAIYCSA